MNGYIALKNTVFNGIGYTAGSIVPAEAVLPSRVPALLRTGVIARADSVAETPAVPAETPQSERNDVEGIVLPIKTDNGVLELPASREDIIKAVEVLQLAKSDGIAAVAEIESEDALIIVDACTKTQELKKAIRERVEALQKAAASQTAPESEVNATGADGDNNPPATEGNGDGQQNGTADENKGGEE